MTTLRTYSVLLTMHRTRRSRSFDSRARVAGLVVLLALVAPAFIQADDAGPAFPVRGLKFSPDGKHLATAAGTKAGGRVVVWKVDDWKPVLVHAESAGCTDVCFSSDGKLLALGTASPRVGILELPSGKLLRAWDAHKPKDDAPEEERKEQRTVHAIAFSPDGKLLATGGSDWMALLWDVADGSLRHTLTGNGQAVMGLAFAPDGRLLTGSADRTMRLWNTGTGKLQQPFWTQQRYVGRVGLSRDGKWFFTAGGSVRIRETASGDLRFMADLSAQDADLSSDGRLLAVAASDEGLQVFPIDLSAPDAKQTARIATLIKQFENDDYALREAASRELEQIGMLAEPQLRTGMKSPVAEVRIRCRTARRQVMSPKPVGSLADDRSDAAAVCFSPDGKLLAGGYRGGDIKVWKVDKFEEVTTLRAVAAK